VHSPVNKEAGDLILNPLGAPCTLLVLLDTELLQGVLFVLGVEEGVDAEGEGGTAGGTPPEVSPGNLRTNDTRNEVYF
jgi:hypothetical protein